VPGFGNDGNRTVVIEDDDVGFDIDIEVGVQKAALIKEQSQEGILFAIEDPLNVFHGIVRDAEYVEVLVTELIVEALQEIHLVVKFLGIGKGEIMDGEEVEDDGFTGSDSIFKIPEISSGSNALDRVQIILTCEVITDKEGPGNKTRLLGTGIIGANVFGPEGGIGSGTEEGLVLESDASLGGNKFGLNKVPVVVNSRENELVMEPVPGVGAIFTEFNIDPAISLKSVGAGNLTVIVMEVDFDEAIGRAKEIFVEDLDGFVPGEEDTVFNKTE